MSGEVSSKINVKSMSVRNERDQEVTEGLQIRGRGRTVKKAYCCTQLCFVTRYLLIYFLKVILLWIVDSMSFGKAFQSSIDLYIPVILRKFDFGDILCFILPAAAPLVL